MYLPRMLANRVLLRKQLIGTRTSITIPNMPPRVQGRRTSVIKEMLPRTLYRPVTPVGQLLWKQHRQAMEDGLLHTFRQQAQDENGGQSQSGRQATRR